MFDDIINSSAGNGDSDDSTPTMTDKLTAAAALTGIAHVLTDYVLSSEDLFDRFYQLVEPEDTSREEMHESIERAHDAFAAMAAQAQHQLMMTRFFEAMGFVGSLPDVTVRKAWPREADDDLPDIDPPGGMYL